MGARAFIIPLALIGAIVLGFAPAAASPASAAEPKTEAQQIIAIAKRQIGDPWRYGATGPAAFDCSGLVTYAYKKAGDLKAIGGGKYRSARALYRYFKARGLASRTNPKLGDLVIWGGGTHVGIYIGNGKAISTLTSGVRIHRVHAVTARFTAYLHTGMWKKPTNPPPPSDTAAAPSAPNATMARDIRKTDGAVNLRTGPGIGYHRLATLRDATRLTVLRSAKDSLGRTWIKVEVGARTGWVAKWLTD